MLGCCFKTVHFLIYYFFVAGLQMRHIIYNYWFSLTSEEKSDIGGNFPTVLVRVFITNRYFVNIVLLTQVTHYGVRSCYSVHYVRIKTEVAAKVTIKIIKHYSVYIN
jgi:hypothetical protein